eukprot:scaffold201305_cov47-Attheya_sp.AAC.3
MGHIHWLGDFEVTEPQDFDGMTLAGPEDRGCFVEARAGDHHIICPFQYQATVALVRQANLDAFWSRAKGMVAKHPTEVRYELRDREVDHCE